MFFSYNSSPVSMIHQHLPQDIFTIQSTKKWRIPTGYVLLMQGTVYFCFHWLLFNKYLSALSFLYIRGSYFLPCIISRSHIPSFKMPFICKSIVAVLYAPEIKFKQKIFIMHVRFCRSVANETFFFFLKDNKTCKQSLIVEKKRK